MSLKRLSREAVSKGLHQGAFRPFAARLFHASTAVQADDQIECKVDGETVRVPKGSTVMQACDAAGVDIPRYIKLPCTLVLLLRLVNVLLHIFACQTVKLILQVLLPSEALYCRQLQNVLGRGMFGMPALTAVGQASVERHLPTTLYCSAALHPMSRAAKWRCCLCTVTICTSMFCR